MSARTSSQTAKIKAWLLEGKSITPLDALNLFGCFRLGARIWDLRNDDADPLPIEMELIENGDKRFAKYRINPAYFKQQ